MLSTVFSVSGQSTSLSPVFIQAFHSVSLKVQDFKIRFPISCDQIPFTHSVVGWKQKSLPLHFLEWTLKSLGLYSFSGKFLHYQLHCPNVKCNFLIYKLTYKWGPFLNIWRRCCYNATESLLRVILALSILFSFIDFIVLCLSFLFFHKWPLKERQWR